MGNTKEYQRRQIIFAAQNYLSEQEDGDLYDAYLKLKDAQKLGDGEQAADDFVNVPEFLDVLSVDRIIELIEASVADNPEAPAFMQNIDWKMLKQQKRTLLEEIDTMETKNAKYYKSVTDDFYGILHLIDSIQDYAADVMGMDENLIFDLHKEEDE